MNNEVLSTCDACCLPQNASIEMLGVLLFFVASPGREKLADDLSAEEVRQEIRRLYQQLGETSEIEARESVSKHRSGSLCRPCFDVWWANPWQRADWRAEIIELDSCASCADQLEAKMKSFWGVGIGVTQIPMQLQTESRKLLTKLSAATVTRFQLQRNETHVAEGEPEFRAMKFAAFCTACAKRLADEPFSSANS